MDDNDNVFLYAHFHIIIQQFEDVVLLGTMYIIHITFILQPVQMDLIQ